MINVAKVKTDKKCSFLAILGTPQKPAPGGPKRAIFGRFWRFAKILNGLHIGKKVPKTPILGSRAWGCSIFLNPAIFGHFWPFLTLFWRFWPFWAKTAFLTIFDVFWVLQKHSFLINIDVTNVVTTLT